MQLKGLCLFKKKKGQQGEDRGQQGKVPAPRSLKSGVKFVVQVWQLSIFMFRVFICIKTAFHEKVALVSGSARDYQLRPDISVVCLLAHLSSFNDLYFNRTTFENHQ